MEALTLGNIATAASVVGSLVSGMAQMQSANYQAEMAARNAIIAQENAVRERERAALEAMKVDNETSSVLGQAEAMQGASGLSLTGRSQVLTRRRTAQSGRLDALNTMTEGEVNARNLENQADEFRASAKMARRSGRFAMLGGMLEAGGKLSGFKNGGTTSTYRPKSLVATATSTRRMY